MTTEPDDRSSRRLTAAWRRYAERPARLSAAEARRRVLNRLPARRAPVSPRAWGLAAAVALVCVGVWLGLRPLAVRGRQEPVTPPRPEAAVVPPLPENVVQWWLDDQTPVYFVLRPLDSKGGS